MRIVNKDMTRENVHLYVSNHQIYARIFFHSHGKWQINEYFQAYEFEIDKDLVDSTVRYIKRTWDLQDPKVEVE